VKVRGVRTPVDLTPNPSPKGEGNLREGRLMVLDLGFDFCPGAHARSTSVLTPGLAIRSGSTFVVAYDRSLA